MRSRFLIIWMIEFSVLFNLANTIYNVEQLDCGMVAVERENGSVFLSWCLLESDPEDIAFQHRRRSSQTINSQSELLTKSSPYYLTNFEDEAFVTNAGVKTYVYEFYQFHTKDKLLISKLIRGISSDDGLLLSDTVG